MARYWELTAGNGFTTPKTFFYSHPSARPVLFSSVFRSLLILASSIALIVHHGLYSQIGYSRSPHRPRLAAGDVIQRHALLLVCGAQGKLDAPPQEYTSLARSRY